MLTGTAILRGLAARLRAWWHLPAVAAPRVERWLWEGRLRITVVGPSGTEVWEGKNLITDAGKVLLASALIGEDDCEIKYLAWGTGSTAAAAGDTTLETEVGRKIVTAQVAGAAAGEVDTTVYLAPQDANVAIEEFGWFAGAAASGTVDTGVLVARVLWSHTKSNLESIQVDRTDDIG